MVSANDQAQTNRTSDKPTTTSLRSGDAPKSQDLQNTIAAVNYSLIRLAYNREDKLYSSYLIRSLVIEHAPTISEKKKANEGGSTQTTQGQPSKFSFPIYTDFFRINEDYGQLTTNQLNLR